MKTTLELDHDGIAKILMEDMRGPVHAAAVAIAAAVDVGSVTDAEVTVRDYTTDRAASAVSIAHPAGLAIQAKYGSLTKAAASIGLEVNAK
jgi:hypothetical protein